MLSTSYLQKSLYFPATSFATTLTPYATLLLVILLIINSSDDILCSYNFYFYSCVLLLLLTDNTAKSPSSQAIHSRLALNLKCEEFRRIRLLTLHAPHGSIRGDLSSTNTVRNRATGFLVVLCPSARIRAVTWHATIVRNNDLCCHITNFLALIRTGTETLFLNFCYLFIDGITSTPIFYPLGWCALVGGEFAGLHRFCLGGKIPSIVAVTLIQCLHGITSIECPHLTGSKRGDVEVAAEAKEVKIRRKYFMMLRVELFYETQRAVQPDNCLEKSCFFLLVWGARFLCGPQTLSLLLHVNVPTLRVVLTYVKIPGPTRFYIRVLTWCCRRCTD